MTKGESQRAVHLPWRNVLDCRHAHFSLCNKKNYFCFLRQEFSRNKSSRVIIGIVPFVYHSGMSRKLVTFFVSNLLLLFRVTGLLRESRNQRIIFGKNFSIYTLKISYVIYLPQGNSSILDFVLLRRISRDIFGDARLIPASDAANAVAFRDIHP